MTTTITATTEPDHEPPRVNLSITTDQTTLTVYRVAADGSKTEVRTNDGGPLQVISGAAILYDPEPPYGLPVSYTTDDAATTTSATVTLDAAGVWLVHPNVPSRSVQVRVGGVSDRSRAANVSVRYPLNRKFPIFASDGQRKSVTYTLTLLTSSPAEYAALDALVDDLSPLLLNVPVNRVWVGMGTEYIGCGDLTVANPGRVLPASWRAWSLPCTVVDRPSGGSQAFNTYGLSKSLYATYADRKAAAATYGLAYNTAN